MKLMKDLIMLVKSFRGKNRAGKNPFSYNSYKTEGLKNFKTLKQKINKYDEISTNYTFIWIEQNSSKVKLPKNNIIKAHKDMRK